ncbi:sensor histidine kinase [Cereibacter sphaeroides f. sp. denitrificans]
MLAFMNRMENLATGHAAAPDETDGQAPRARRALPLSLLLGLLTLAAFLPFFALASYTFLQQVRTVREAEYHRLEELAANLATAVDRELTWRTATANILSASRSLAKGDIDAFGALAEDAAREAQGTFILTGSDYRQLVNTALPPRTRLPDTPHSDAIDRVLAGQVALVGDLITDAVSGRLAFALRIPVAGEGENRYVLTYQPDPASIQRVLEATYRPEGWFAGVIDGSGAIVARSHRPEEFFGRSGNPEFLAQLVGRSGRLESVDLEGRIAVTAFHRSSVSPWTAIVWAPQDLLNAPAQRLAGMLLLLVVLATLATVAAAVAAGRLIRRPFARLVGTARRLGQGRAVAFVPTLMAEANEVGASLTDAADRIARREAALRRNEATMKVVMKELSHRSKNLLAVVQAVARQSARRAADFEAFRQAFEARLAGLARSQDLLVSSDWESVPLDALARSQIAANPDGGRVAISGPEVLLRPEAAQTLGMAFHELGTNATKHGALSAPQGRVEVSWKITSGGEPRLHLRWQERGGPQVVAPEETGFGTVVIEGMTAANVDGHSAFVWEGDGLLWTLEAPMRELTVRDGGGGGA